MSDISQETQTIAQDSNDDTNNFYVVGVGASAGGLEALEALFSNMPVDSGMAFVVVQHLSPDFNSLMDELLARHTEIPIHRVEDGVQIKPNNVYLIPPKKNMALSDGCLLLTERDSSGGLNLPIDIFFRTLAHDAGQRAVAIVLSGTGSDGSRGIESVHEAGGLVIVQDIESAAFDGMPRNAVATGLAHLVIDPDRIPEHLTKHKEDPESLRKGLAEFNGPIEPGTEMASIFGLFRSRYGIDFTLYRENTIQRRLERRIQLVRCANLAEYVQKIMDDQSELDALYRDLLVEVTEFFRNSQAFERLKEEIIPGLFAKDSASHDEIRIWVPGCATGEEAYSLAMLMSEAIDAMRLQYPRVAYPIVKVFATDVHRNSLEFASAGVYSSEALVSVPADMKEKYFLNSGSLYHVSRELRKMVIFAPHDITRDPPFTKVNLISCRNVLIYLEPSVQRRVLSLFHFGLKVGGTMMLGPSETVGELSAEFETVDQHWRIFRKLRDVRLPDVSRVKLSTPLISVVRKPHLDHSPLSRGLQTDDFVHRTLIEDLLDRYVPPTLVVNDRHELVHTFGEARFLLVQPKGRPTLDVLKLVEGDLRMAINAALRRGRGNKEPVVLKDVRVQFPDGPKFCRVVSELQTKRQQQLFMITVEPETETQTVSTKPDEEFEADNEAAQQIIDLERELEFNKESLQTTVKELESSSEELQSTNEELVASNEELQSTNEELHSVNEELFTVNAEHQRKIDELLQLTSDLDNLMRSTDIGTLFLDRELRIRRFTSAITQAFNVLEQDIGRPIDQFAYNFDSPGWLQKAKEVIETGETFEYELRSKSSEDIYLKRMRPYRIIDDAIGGVVITFTNVTAIAKAEEERKGRERFERIATDLQDFVYAVSRDLQAPVRQVEQCLSQLRESHESRNYDEFSDHLRRAETRASSLQKKLDCLLDYSRANASGEEFSRIDLSELLLDLTRELRVAELGGDVTMDPMPVIVGDPTQIKTLFRHLMDNAIKYNNGRPKIHFSSQSRGENWCVSVQDNGIGIPQQHLDSVFVVFHRVGVKEDIEGLGIGLSICRRILERQGGRIECQSSASGTTMILTFPSDQTPNTFTSGRQLCV